MITSGMIRGETALLRTSVWK